MHSTAGTRGLSAGDQLVSQVVAYAGLDADSDDDDDGTHEQGQGHGAPFAGVSPSRPLLPTGSAHRRVALPPLQRDSEPLPVPVARRGTGTGHAHEGNLYA